MSQAQAERAKQQLYEDTSSRDELIDEEAEVLLKWGETQIDALAAQELDDMAFDAGFAHLRRVMVNVNRFTGKRSYAAPEELKTYLDQLATEASALGVNVTAQQLDGPNAQTADDNIALIQSLTGMLAIGNATETTAQVVPEAIPPVDEVDTIPETPPVESPPDDKPEDTGLWGKFGKLFSGDT